MSIRSTLVLGLPMLAASKETATDVLHPAYPPAADLSREARTITHDLADLETLGMLRIIVSHALAKASRCEAIHHPDRRWTTDDLTEAFGSVGRWSRLWQR